MIFTMKHFKDSWFPIIKFYFYDEIFQDHISHKWYLLWTSFKILWFHIIVCDSLIAIIQSNIFNIVWFHILMRNNIRFYDFTH